MKRALTEDELYFGLVTQDSCLFGEFFFQDELSKGLGFRQKIMFCDESPRQAVSTARSVAKTTRMGCEYIRIGLTQTGEGLFAFPQQRHMDPISQRLDHKINDTAIFRAMRTGYNKTKGIEEWRKGKWVWNWRIEGVDGSDRNMVGLHTNAIFGDEMAFGGLSCYQSRSMGALPDCRYIYAGVPNNWRGSTLYRLDQTDMGHDWSHHRMERFDNPLYDSPKEKQEAIRRSGGEHTQEYLTQVLGQWGDELATSFPPAAIAQKMNLIIFEADWGEGDLLMARSGSTVTLERKLAAMPSVDAPRYAIGLDAGYSPDPSVLFIFYEGVDGAWYELAHIQLNAVAYLNQARTIHAINRLLGYKVCGIGIEYTGVGISVAQELMRTDMVGQYSTVFDYASVLVNSNPGGTIEVPLSTREDVSYIVQESMGIFSEQLAEGDRTVKQTRKAWMTEQLRLAMLRANQGYDGLKIWLGPDNRLVESIINVGERRTTAGNITYSKMDPSVPDHPVDALRSTYAAIHHAIGFDVQEQNVGEKGFGWVDWDENWRAPWTNAR